MVSCSIRRQAILDALSVITPPRYLLFHKGTLSGMDRKNRFFAVKVDGDTVDCEVNAHHLRKSFKKLDSERVVVEFRGDSIKLSAEKSSIEIPKGPRSNMMDFIDFYRLNSAWTRCPEDLLHGLSSVSYMLPPKSDLDEDEIDFNENHEDLFIKSYGASYLRYATMFVSGRAVVTTDNHRICHCRLNSQAPFEMIFEAHILGFANKFKREPFIDIAQHTHKGIRECRGVAFRFRDIQMWFQARNIKNMANNCKKLIDSVEVKSIVEIPSDTIKILGLDSGFLRCSNDDDMNIVIGKDKLTFSRIIDNKAVTKILPINYRENITPLTLSVKALYFFDAVQRGGIMGYGTRKVRDEIDEFLYIKNVNCEHLIPVCRIDEEESE